MKTNKQPAMIYALLGTGDYPFDNDLFAIGNKKRKILMRAQDILEALKPEKLAYLKENHDQQSQYFDTGLIVETCPLNHSIINYQGEVPSPNAIAKICVMADIKTLKCYYETDLEGLK